MAVRIADLISLVSDLVDFYRSAHEALADRRRRRAEAAKSADGGEPSRVPQATDVRPTDSASTS